MQKGHCLSPAPAATRLDDVATNTYHAAPDDVARLGFAIAHLLDESAPEVPDLPADLAALAAEIAQALKKSSTATRDLRTQLQQRGDHPGCSERGTSPVSCLDCRPG